MDNIEKKDNNRRQIRLLILSYHYLPMNVIASYRPNGFLDHFYKFGVFPTLVTHQWELNQSKKWIYHSPDSKPTIEFNSNNTIIRLPRYRTFWGNMNRFVYKFYLLRQVSIFSRWALGILDSDSDSLDSYLTYKKYLFDHLKNHKYDIVIGIFSPHHHLKLCFEINKKFNIPYILDFRDLWDNRATHIEYKPKGVNKLYVFFVKKHWSRWLSNARFFTTLSQQWINTINEFTYTKGYIIMHGFDTDIEVIRKSSPSSTSFILMYIGSLYQNQDLEKFLIGVKEFLNECAPQNFKVVFLGSLRSNRKVDRSFFENIDDILKKYLNPANYILTQPVPRNEVLDWYREASVLLSISYKTYPGTYGGKFFEYIGTGRPILVSSEDECIISKTVLKHNLGFISKSKSDMKELLKFFYNEWEEKGEVSKNPWSKISQFSRYHQTLKLSELIVKNLKK